MAKFKTFKKAAKAVKKGQTALQRVGDGLVEAEKIRQTVANDPIPSLLKIATKVAASKKVPIGFIGLNLMSTSTRDIAISGEATGDVTTSASMYMYRPPRKRVPDAVQYCMKRVATSGAINSVAGNAKVFDCNLLDGEPVQNNPNTANDYTRMSIRRAFDNLLLGETKLVSTTTDKTMKKQQQSIHVKSFTNELTVTNLLSSACLFDIYELVPQHNLNGTVYFPDSDRYAVGYMSPTWTYNQGLNSTDVIETDNDLASTNVAANPFVSTTFSRTWKVVKHVRVNMTGNSVHRHKSVYSINKTVSYQEMAQLSTEGGKFAGWNPTFLCIQRGAPSSQSTADATSISYSTNMQLNYEATPDQQSKVIVFEENT